MAYMGLTKGRIEEVYFTEKFTDYSQTRVLIGLGDELNNKSTSTYVFGKLSQADVGKDIKIVRADDGLRFNHRVFLDGKLEIDQTVTKRV